MPAVGSVNVKIGATTTGLTKGLTSARSSLTSFGSSVLGMASGVGLATAGLFGLSKGFDVVSSAVKGAADMEQAEIAFGVLFKSTDTAKQVLGDLSTFAAETPFELPELTGAARSLAAFGTAATDIVPTMKRIGDVSAGIGQPIGEIAELYGKAKVQGRLFGEDINQLTGRGIPIIGELAKQFGVSEDKVKGLVEQGKVGFPQLEMAFKNMTSTGGMFEGMMDKQSKSLGGLWSTLKDNVGSTARDIATELIGAFDVKSSLAGVINFTGLVKDGVKSIVPAVQAVASVFSTAWSVIATGATALRSGLIANLGGSFTNITERVKATGAYITSTLEAVRPIAAATGAYLASLWSAIANGAMVAFSFITSTLGTLFTNVSAIFSSITGVAGVTFATVKDFIIDSLIVGEFLFNNFGAVAAFAFENIKLAAVTCFNDIGHFFTGVIPAWFTWFGQSWKDVFFTAFDLATTVFINLGTNIRNMFASLWKWIKSGFRSSLEINWTPLTEGFVNSVKTLPDIPARAVTELEQKLKNNVASMGNSLGTQMGEHMVKRREELLGKPVEMPKRVDVTGPAMSTGPVGMTPATTTAASKPLEGVAALNRGSGDAYSAIFKAMRGEPVQEKILKATEKQLAETKQVRKSLDKMTNSDGIQWVAGEVIV